MEAKYNGINIGENGISVQFEIDTQFTANDLKEGDIVTLRNGDRLLFTGVYFEDLGDGKNDNNLTDLSDLSDDLTYYDVDEKENDIMKVERPINYMIRFERKEEIREMTLEEVCNELGYNVKIIKEEK